MNSNMNKLKELHCFVKIVRLFSNKESCFHRKSKHIRIKYHFIRDLVKDDEINVMHCKTQEHIADIFTKALKYDVLKKMKEKLVMMVI